MAVVTEIPPLLVPIVAHNEAICAECKHRTEQGCALGSGHAGVRTYGAMTRSGLGCQVPERAAMMIHPPLLRAESPSGRRRRSSMRRVSTHVDAEVYTHNLAVCRGCDEFEPAVAIGAADVCGRLVPVSGCAKAWQQVLASGEGCPVPEQAARMRRSEGLTGIPTGGVERDRPAPGGLT